ncbi:MAG: PilZ domain-containing protein [Bdellovibrionota bacterium]
MDHPFLEILSGDKRKIKRIDLPRPVDTTLNYLGEMIPVKMVDFSFSGVGLYVPVEYTKNEKIILTESHLQFPQHKFEGQLVYQQRKDDGIIQVGFSLPVNLKQSYLFKKMTQVGKLLMIKKL